MLISSVDESVASWTCMLASWKLCCDCRSGSGNGPNKPHQNILFWHLKGSADLILAVLTLKASRLWIAVFGRVLTQSSLTLPEGIDRAALSLLAVTCHFFFFFYSVVGMHITQCSSVDMHVTTSQSTSLHGGRKVLLWIWLTWALKLRGIHRRTRWTENGFHACSIFTSLDYFNSTHNSMTLQSLFGGLNSVV